MDHHKNWSIRVKLEILVKKMANQISIHFQKQERVPSCATYTNVMNMISFDIYMIYFVVHQLLYI